MARINIDAIDFSGVADNTLVGIDANGNLTASSPSITLPAYPTASRSATPTAGDSYYDTTTNEFTMFGSNSSWVSAEPPQPHTRLFWVFRCTNTVASVTAGFKYKQNISTIYHSYQVTPTLQNGGVVLGINRRWVHYIHIRVQPNSANATRSHGFRVGIWNASTVTGWFPVYMGTSTLPRPTASGFIVHDVPSGVSNIYYLYFECPNASFSDSYSLDGNWMIFTQDNV